MDERVDRGEVDNRDSDADDELPFENGEFDSERSAGENRLLDEYR